MPTNSKSSHGRHRKDNTSLQLSSQQNETIDNLVQKLEDHIATELDRFGFCVDFEEKKSFDLLTLD